MAAGLTERLAELGHAPAATHGGVPCYAPASPEQAAELLGTCSREGWRVRLLGAGSRGGEPVAADLVVSSRALAGFDIYEPDDLTVGMLAGTRHRDAAAELARHQQMLLLDPPGPPQATVGGSFAAGEAGPLRAGYGTPRDLALGLTLVTGDGRVLRLGGQVVKNVAGYDLVRLVVGSRGTLGLITQLHMRLRSQPPSDVTVTAAVTDPAAAAELALRIRDAAAPVALELLGPERDGEPWLIATRLHGSHANTAGALASVRRLLPDAAALEPGMAADFWTALAGAESGAPARIRCSVLPSALPDLLRAAGPVLNLRSDNGLAIWRAAVHATEGVLRLWTREPAPPPDGSPAEVLADLERTAVSLSGTCICDRGPAALRRLLPGPHPAPRLLQLERELRLRFDPAAVLVGD